jgi:hypothetical protein
VCGWDFPLSLDGAQDIRRDHGTRLTAARAAWREKIARDEAMAFGEKREASGNLAHSGAGKIVDGPIVWAIEQRLDKVGSFAANGLAAVSVNDKRSYIRVPSKYEIPRRSLDKAAVQRL